jgi:hypothetical protein
MQGQINPKIVGATIIGFALVAGAFTVSSLNQDMVVPQPAAVAMNNQPRVSIAVTDTDDNGIEDWRDEFVTTEPIVLDSAESTYTPPDTLTGKMSIGLMENYIRSKNYGPFGSPQEELITNTINNLSRETEVKIYDTPDIDIMREWDDEDVVNYANTAAATLHNNNVPNTQGEIEILHDIVTTGDRDRLKELETLVGVYQGYRDDTLLIPVPTFLVKEHLDLINSYHAIYEDIKAMSLTFNDPAVTLLRLKRYQDDATGLWYSLQNMSLALEPYVHLITADDPALLFGVFSPDYQI